ncbi:MAG: ferrochelatase [Bdellovibrionota bacterium]
MYTGRSEFRHGDERKIGILLVNLGTPDAPTPAALRPYLKAFLADPRVIEVPRLKWWFILNLFILPFRPKQSAKLYEKVWTPEGSPLLTIGIQQRDALRARLEQLAPGRFAVELGMRIGKPSLESAMQKLEAANITKLLVVPLFPQYSGTTTGSVFDGVTEVLHTRRWIPEFRMIMSYHDHPRYISALAASVQELWSKNGRPKKLLMSFHGVPKRYFEGGDPYHCYCQKTGRLLAEALRLSSEEYVISFQSLFGKEEWLRPYTSDTLTQLAKDGVTDVDVICPGFAADCLETIEEIEEQNKEIFLEHGGKQFRYIHALNSRPDHIEMFADLISQHTVGWHREDAEGSEKRVEAFRRA